MGYRGFTCIVQRLVILLGLIVSEFKIGARAGDVLDLLSVINQTNPNITFITGIDPLRQAVLFEETSRNILLPEGISSEALMRLRNNDDVTFLATVRQKMANHGSIFSFSAGHYRFFELDSNGQWDEITLYYIHDQHIYQKTFPFRLANNHWHQLALTLRRSHVTLYINCTKVYEGTLPELDRQHMLGSHINLYIGQRNQHSTLFMGAIEELKLITRPNGYLDQCPAHNTSEFQNVHSSFNTNTLFQNLTIKNKTTDCRRSECPEVTCENPVQREGECCPVCLRNCVYFGVEYLNGASVSLKKCTNCTCKNGSMICERLDPSRVCPKLECGEEDIIEVQGQCCPICRGTDFCSHGHDCHRNATCVNLSTRYACQCKRGFQGNGTDCDDINECLAVGGLTGHHCHKDQQCENTIGSYKCLCLSGHMQNENLSCADLLSGQKAITFTKCSSTLLISVMMAWLCLLINYVQR